MKIQYQDEQLIIFESELFRTTTSLIVGKNHLLLVDPNWLPREIDYIEAHTRKLGAGKQKYLLFTHSDYDHIIGYGRFKDFQTIASQAFVDNKQQASILNQIREFDDQYYIKRGYEITYPTIDQPIIGDGIQIELGSEEYFFYQAPGHNSDGIITYNKSKQILIVGDYLSNIEFPYLYDSYNRYQTTLNKLEQLITSEAVAFLISGHGDYTNNKPKMHQRIADARVYLQLLVDSIQQATPFDFDRLMTQYDFPGIMRKFHDGNVNLVAQELKNHNS
ncbi:MAG: MBL fold metallo-hydrolase [Bacteroidota bacterium]